MNDSLLKRLPFHYGWVVVVAAMVAVFACLGMGRFALGMMLPSMAGPLGLDYRQMGLISTANFVGYLAAVMISGRLASRVGASKLIFLALVLVGVTMALVGLAGHYPSVLLLYALTGLGSGAANIPAIGLVSAWFARSMRGRAAGFVVIGSGFGIILAGWMIPFVNREVGEWGWRANWLIAGTVVLGAALFVRVLLRDRPSDMGLVPHGHGDSPPRESGSMPGLWRVGRLYHLGVLYFIFGFTYAIYITFIVTSLVRDRGFSESEAGGFWMTVGVLSLLSGPVFGTLSDRYGRRAGFAAVFVIQGIAYLFAALGISKLMLYMSVVLFGLGAWSIVTIMAAAVGDCVGAARASEGFGAVTVAFALGQISGPYVAGWLASEAGGLSASFALASAMAGLAVAVSLMLRGTGRSWEAEAEGAGESPG